MVGWWGYRSSWIIFKFRPRKNTSYTPELGRSAMIEMVLLEPGVHHLILHIIVIILQVGRERRYFVELEEASEVV